MLILFHGLGDTHLPFAKLGSQMNLPETACISVKALEPLPFEPSSFHWGDDVIFDNTVGMCHYHHYHGIENQRFKHIDMS